MFTATTLWKQVYKYIYPVQFSSTNTWLFPFDFIYTNIREYKKIIQMK